MRVKWSLGWSNSLIGEGVLTTTPGGVLGWTAPSYTGRILAWSPYFIFAARGFTLWDSFQRCLIIVSPALSPCFFYRNQDTVDLDFGIFAFCFPFLSNVMYVLPFLSTLVFFEAPTFKPAFELGISSLGQTLNRCGSQGYSYVLTKLCDWAMIFRTWSRGLFSDW